MVSISLTEHGKGEKEKNITQKTFPCSNCILCYRILPDAIAPTLQHGKAEKREKYHSENIPIFQLYTVLQLSGLQKHTWFVYRTMDSGRTFGTVFL